MLVRCHPANTSAATTQLVTAQQVGLAYAKCLANFGSLGPFIADDAQLGVFFDGVLPVLVLSMCLCL